MNTTLHASVHTQRRAQLAAQLGPGGMAIVPTAPEQPRNRDSEFLYRHDSYFYYLTGFTEPGACLVLTHDGHSTLFCQPKDLEREIWDGYRLGPDAAPEALGVDAAHSDHRTGHAAAPPAGKPRRVWYPFATHSGLAARVEGWLGAVRARVRYGALCPEHAERPVRSARRDAALQGRARAGHHAPRQRRSAPGPHPRHAARGAHAARGPGPARVPPGRRVAARLPRGRRAMPGLRLASSLRGPMPACCTTGPTPPRCATASWC